MLSSSDTASAGGLSGSVKMLCRSSPAKPSRSSSIAPISASSVAICRHKRKLEAVNHLGICRDAGLLPYSCHGCPRLRSDVFCEAASDLSRSYMVVFLLMTEPKRGNWACDHLTKLSLQMFALYVCDMRGWLSATMPCWLGMLVPAEKIRCMQKGGLRRCHSDSPWFCDAIRALLKISDLSRICSALRS